MDPILRFDGVSKSFQGQPVLEDFNLELQAGEFLTLLGPSGCGKTTCLNLIAGFLRPDAGSISLRGQVVNDVPPRKRNLSMVFQTWALFPHMTAFENVAFGLMMRGRSRSLIETRVREMLELVRLSGAGGKYPSQLSGGMRQRLALARSLAVEPSILLLDEPLSALDAALRKEMQVELKRIHEKLRVTTIFVTHNQEEALTMSDRIAVMRAGRIVRLDTPQVLYTDPCSRFVCTFMGDVNIFEGAVEALDESTATLRAGPYWVRFPRRDGLTMGAKACVAVRPERVAVQSQPSPRAVNSIAGVVRHLVYSGNSVQYWVEAQGRELLALDYQKSGGALPGRGDSVHLEFQPDAVMVLDRD
jgi:spermidine/putrescine ABC transporter ATP-binding subunit